MVKGTVINTNNLSRFLQTYLITSKIINTYFKILDFDRVAILVFLISHLKNIRQIRWRHFFKFQHLDFFKAPYLFFEMTLRTDERYIVLESLDRKSSATHDKAHRVNSHSRVIAASENRCSALRLRCIYLL